MAEYTKPLPELTKLNRPYWEGCRTHELRLQQCTQCGHRWFPPSTNCPQCLSTAYEWKPVSGRGQVWSWIVMHQHYFKSFAEDVPYNVAFIQLEEGPFLISTLVDIPPDQIRCDLPVEVVFTDATDQVGMPKFGPRRS